VSHFNNCSQLQSSPAGGLDNGNVFYEPKFDPEANSADNYFAVRSIGERKLNPIMGCHSVPPEF
jgi:hypothetical protein